MLSPKHTWQHPSTISAVERVVRDPNHEGRCIVTCRSILDGRHTTRSIPTPRERILAWLVSGDLVQRALPELTPDERELLISGVSSDAWEALERQHD